VSLVNCSGEKSACERLLEDRKETLRYARQIKLMQERSDRGELAAALEHWDGKASAGECARAAGVPLDRLARGESSTPRRLRDGGILHSETYRLRAVRLLQAARFLDYAEENFATITCENLQLTPAGGHDGDSWDVTCRLRYVEPKG
jgi:hypothetical protein